MVSFDTKEAIRVDGRRGLRVKEALPILWRVKDAEIRGSGQIRNISDSGMMFEAPIDSSLNNNTIFTFETSNGHSDYLPQAGRLVWSRKPNLNGHRCQLGVEFIESAQETLAHLREKIKIRVERTRNIEKAKNISGVFLIAALVLLTGFAVMQQIAVEKSYEQSTHMLLSTSASQAGLYVEVSNDLKETKTILAQTQDMLAQAKEQNVALEGELAEAHQSLSDLRDELSLAHQSIQTLNNENTKLSEEVADLNERLRPFEGEIASIQDGKSSSQIVRKRLRAIKLGIRSLKHKARLAMIAAQKENDKILLASGNQGYLVRGSQPVRSNFTATGPEKKVKIDVTIFGQP